MIELYKEIHETQNVYNGSALILHAQSIKDIIGMFNVKTMLDYGCGKGKQYSEENIHEEYFRNIQPTMYDPAVEKFSETPKGKFDLVICTDVLEHIPEEDLDGFLKELYSKADTAVYLGICNVPADTFLSDGRNSHVTLKSFDWWVDKILPFAKLWTQVYVYGTERGTARLENKTILMRIQK
jgi:cyclopropane fatty-acyl-phospholipid synthase-like methyltransferase